MIFVEAVCMVYEVLPCGKREKRLSLGDKSPNAPAHNTQR